MVPVLLDDELMKRISMRFLATLWGNLGSEITISEAFRALPKDFREAGIWHEMGHIHHVHHLKGEFSNQNQLRETRIAAVVSGQITWYEAEADRFAVARAGKAELIGLLTHLLETRPSGGKLSSNELGKRELELRIKANQAL